MSFKGTNSKVIEDTADKGIDGVNAISDIPAGFVIEAENVDLSQPGVIRKRAGYNLWGCPLPVRIRETDRLSGRDRFLFDFSPIFSASISIYPNTGANNTATQDAESMRVDDGTHTAFITLNTGGRAITTDTIFEAIGTVDYGSGGHTSVKRYFQPVEVLSDGSEGLAKIIAPYVAPWFSAVVPTDLVPLVVTARVGVGYAFNRMVEEDVTEISLTHNYATSSTIVKIQTSESFSPEEVLHLGDLISFDTGFPYSNIFFPRTTRGASGVVTEINSDSFVVACEIVSSLPEGYFNPRYFSMRYMTGGGLWVKSKDYDMSASYSYFAPDTAPVALFITGVGEFVALPNVWAGNAPSADVTDFLFVYGTGVSAGYVQTLNKYFDVESQSDRLVCGVYGSLFVEDDHPQPTIPTIIAGQYTAASANIDAVSGRFTVPITGAQNIYLAGDDVTIRYARNTAGDITEDTYTVIGTGTDQLVLDSRGLPQLFIPQYCKVNFKRKSSRIYVAIDGTNIDTHMKYVPGTGVWVGEANSQNPWYTIESVTLGNIFNPDSNPYITLTQEVEWESSTYLTAISVFLPVFQSTASDTYPLFDKTETLGSFHDVQSSGIERSVILAAEKSGMWRFNGAQLLNMRIPTPTAGYIRNVNGSGGTLKVDETNDGVKVGRFYRFYVSYSYSELVNGKLVRYESGLNPIGSYRLTSKPAIDGSDTSQLVELQVATIPNGIGLPASDMTINVYRSPSGTANDVESDTEVLLKEVEVPNSTVAPFIRVLAGIAPKLQFNEENYDFLYLSQGGDRATDESSRNIVDAPFAKVLTTQENRIVAANGWDWPYVNLICKRVFDPSTGSFAAHGRFTLVPPSTSETAYRFITCPCSLLTTSGTAGGAGGPTFQSIGIPTYAVKAIAYSDNSHLFKLNGYAPTAGTRYVLRFSNGIREAKGPGGKDPYFEGFGFEEQVFLGTSVANQLSAAKKWTTTDSTGALKSPLSTEQVIVFKETQSITAVASDNGIKIEGNTGIGVKGGSVKVTLFVKDTTVATYANGDWLILKGLGTTGQIQDASGKSLSWDTDIIAKVTDVSTAGNPDEYVLDLYVKGSPTSSFVPVQNPKAISVSNTSLGVQHGPFTIFKETSGATPPTDYDMNSFSLTPTTATIQLTTSPAIAPAAGTRICVDGLPEFIPANCEMNFNTNFEITNFAVDTFTVKVTAPPNMRGTGGQDFTGDPNPGKVGVPSLSFPRVPGSPIVIDVTDTVMALAVATGDWAYMIVRGKDQDSYCMELTGWFRVGQLRVGGVWGASVSIGATLQGVELDPGGNAIDYSAITGISETRIIFCGRASIGGYTTLNIPVPVPLSQRYDADVTGTFYGPYDGYTPLEKVSKRLAHAVSCVLHSSYWGYWGKFRPDLEREQDIPTNGCRVQPHMWPENAYRYHRTTYLGTTGTTESGWKCEGEPGYWKVEGEDTFEPSWTPVTTYTAKKYRPSRIFWTNKAGTAEGVSFRELSLEEIDSDDGDEIVGMVPFQTYSIAAKRSSVWRASFQGGTILSVQKVPSTVGSASAKNMVATERGVFFLHESGLYITDGALVEPVLQTSRYFNSRVVQNKDLFNFTAGHHNPLGKTVYLGIPLSDSEGELASGVSGQFVFNYSLRNVTLNTIDYGWSVNTQIPATAWTRIKTDDFFATDTGKICKIRTENGPTRFSDNGVGIPFKLSTRYIDSQDPIDFKFYRSLFFQFGKETSANMKVSLAWDFAKDYTLISTIPIMQEGFGTAPFGTSYWGCDRYIETIRRTPVHPRVAQLSIRLENDEVNTASEVYGIFLESTQITSKLHKQPGV